ncbi:GtrA family protein [Actinocrinis puniceicyclus]|uniref:GtrA family protein n=1 Tax=Actinocrinis puniceicyclus TaxID=977794 RepID=A0A8J8BCQ3_9ACTN|nr:GtrA family protein [Actinocrinis puniceicyclus]MBS2963745.1 GtrA family protein [Actinocrinis puniceicyclus]
MRRWAVGIVRRLWREMVGFSMVGVVGVTCDIATFNLVIGVFHAPKVYGSVAGTTLGTVVGYLGNRFWVFRRRDRRQSAAEVVLYLLVSGVGMLITAACVAFNEYVLGYTSLLAANVAQFIVGQGLGTVFRFWAMHRWVFPEARALDYAADPAAARPDEEPATAVLTSCQPADAV